MAKKPEALSGPLKILLIEDDPDDIDLFEYAFRVNELLCDVVILEEGDQVLPYLTKSNKRPDVVVLDLNLPKVHGRDILKQIKSDEELQAIPVVILTTSSEQEDKEYCKKAGAADFLTKPTDLEGFKTMVSTIARVVTA
ncbi:response regulator [Spirosoma sp. SC4-14]|uniref:response regulator n=1 Tax=Spirosoma sp. SC4-14 TaxID=3128900 RepID=UPI0030CD4198